MDVPRDFAWITDLGAPVRVLRPKRLPAVLFVAAMLPILFVLLFVVVAFTQPATGISNDVVFVASVALWVICFAIVGYWVGGRLARTLVLYEEGVALRDQDEVRAWSIGALVEVVERQYHEFIVTDRAGGRFVLDEWLPDVEVAAAALRDGIAIAPDASTTVVSRPVSLWRQSSILLAGLLGAAPLLFGGWLLFDRATDPSNEPPRAIVSPAVGQSFDFNGPTGEPELRITVTGGERRSAGVDGREIVELTVIYEPLGPYGIYVDDRVWTATAADGTVEEGEIEPADAFVRDGASAPVLVSFGMPTGPVTVSFEGERFVPPLTFEVAP